MQHFVSVAELARLVAASPPPRLLDVRWSLAEPDGHAAHLDGHLPGAVWVDLEHELSRHGRPDEGRHPLPATTDLQSAARRWGLDDGDVVVAYDDANGVAAARAWWLLRRAGIEVRVLDGGLAAWRAAGLPVEAGEVTPAPGSVTLTDATAGTLDIDQAAAFPAAGVLIDARTAERFRGDIEPIDPIPGHIPGAVNVPLTALVDDTGRVRDAAALSAAFARVGARPGVPVAAYCGSGVTAAHTALVLAELGIDAAIYPGSWSAWSNTPGRPVAVGDDRRRIRRRALS
ncbi:MAG: sulfurtransferase [Microbacterium sp.]|uniref:sulfurtransferase n=1 Tax=Microbacterium sp. TaxID=51671 RepID=UPI003A8C5683